MRSRFVLVTLLWLQVSAVAARQSELCSDSVGNPAPPIVYYVDEHQVRYADQIAAYLDATGTTEDLEQAIETSNTEELPSVHAEVVSADFTGDHITDVFVLIDLSWGGGYEMFLSLYTCADDGYTHLDSIEFDTGNLSSSDADDGTIVLTADLNGNDTRDIVLRKSTVEGMKVHETISIYEWNNAAMVRTFQLGPNYGKFTHLSLSNWDEDPTTLEMTIGYFFAYEQETALSFGEYNLVRPIEILYAWDGAEYSFVCQHFDDSPSIRFQVLHSAETLISCGLYEEAQVYYQQLWNNGDVGVGRRDWIQYPTGLTEEELERYAPTLERDYLRAFAGYRLFQLALEDPTSDEAVYVNHLMSEYEIGEHSYVYAAMVTALWETYQATQDLGEACAVAEDTFQSVRENGDDPGITYDAEYGFYLTSTHRYGANPDNLFDVPPDIDSMVSSPICFN